MFEPRNEISTARILALTAGSVFVISLVVGICLASSSTRQSPFFSQLGLVFGTAALVTWFSTALVAAAVSMFGILRCCFQMAQTDTNGTTGFQWRFLNLGYALQSSRARPELKEIRLRLQRHMLIAFAAVAAGFGAKWLLALIS